ncbi:hypothetical protein MMC34_005677 [Xylographa carneopallida]|nr:hypothetical protein [Xylographa carneopallida]
MTVNKRQKTLSGASPSYHVDIDSIYVKEVISNDEDHIIDKALRAEVGNTIAGIGKPYSAASETPRLAAFHPSFRMVERMSSEILGGGAWILQKSAYEHAETAKLLESMLRHQVIAYPKPKRIGLMGDSGVGKSTLINSLLNTPGLAHQGSNGAACTCVVSEYHAAWASQSKRFAAEIKFFEPAERETILKEYFADFYRFTLEDVDELEEATRRDFELRHDTAIEAFLALYAGIPEFKSEEAAQEFLGLRPQTMTLVVEKAADTAEELTGKIERFVKTWNREYVLPSPWPLVKLVKIGLHSAFLSRGVVLADLPGLSDVNRTRVKLTQLYIRDCDFIFLVAKVSRVQTDSNTSNRLYYGVRRALGPRKALICTCADLGSHNQIWVSQLTSKEMDEFTKPRDLAASPIDKQQYDRILSSWTSLNNEIKRFSDSMTGFHGQTRAEALDERQLLKLKKKALHVMKLGVLIKMRNKKITAAMQKKYESTTKKKVPLRVICVLNEHYALHQTGYTEDLIPCSIEIVGISDVCLCALMLPSAHKMKTLQEYYQSRPHWTTRGLGAATEWTKERTPWKATLLEPVMKDLYKSWTIFDVTAKDASEKCLSSLNGLLDMVVADIKDFPGADLASIKSFNESLETQKAVIYIRISDIRAAVEKLSRNVKLDATTAEANAYVPVAMEPVYRDCAAVTGTGRSKVQRALLENAISRGVPFLDIASKVEKAFENFLETNRTTFTTELEKIFDEIPEDFDLRFRVQEVHDPDRDELRRQLHDFVVQAKTQMDGPMMEELDRAEKDSISTEGLLGG